MTKARKGPAPLFFNIRESLSESTNVHFVDNGLIPWNPLLAACHGPLEARIDNDTFGHKGRAIPFVESEIVHRFHLVSEQRRVPGQLTGVTAGVRIKQKLIGIESVARLRLIRSVDAISIDGGRSNVRQITVPDLVGVFRQYDAFEFAFASLVEQAQLDFGRVSRKEGEVCTFAVPCCAARMRQTLLHHTFPRFLHDGSFAF